MRFITIFSGSNEVAADASVQYRKSNFMSMQMDLVDKPIFWLISDSYQDARLALVLNNQLVGIYRFGDGFVPRNRCLSHEYVQSNRICLLIALVLCIGIQLFTFENIMQISSIYM